MSGLSLYQVAAEFSALANSLADCDAPEEAIRDTLEGEAWPVEQKARAVIAVTLNLGAEADAVEAAAKKLMDRAKTIRAQETRLRKYLQECMALAGITEIKALDGTFRAKLYRERDQSIDVFDPEQLPDDYMREIPAKLEPDKALIKSALQDGYDVPGARIVRKDRLEIK